MANEDSRCYLCNQPVDSDMYCHGCNQLICYECDDGEDSPMGPHEPGAHIDEGLH